jgi:hypothetical protein
MLDFNIGYDEYILASLMSQTSALDLASIESELKGKTLLVYWYFLKSPTSAVGVREIQHACMRL